MRGKIIVLSLIAIVIVAGSFAMMQSRAVTAMAEGALTGELTKVFGDSAHVGEIEVDSFHSVALHNVTVYDKQGRLAVVADKVGIVFSLFDILRGKDAAASVSEVTVISPRMELVQAATGRWNIEDLVDMYQGNETVFSGKVKMTDAFLALTIPQGNFQLTNVTAALDFVHKPWIAVTVSGRHQGALLSAEGRVTSKLEGVLTVKAEKLAVSQFTGLQLPAKGFKLIDGTLTDVVVTLNKNKETTAYAGEAHVSGVKADGDGWSIQDAGGFVTFTDKNLYLFGAEAKLSGQPLRLQGKIAIAGAEPVFDLTVQSPGFDPSVIPGEIPVRGPVAFDARLAGTMTRPVVSGQFTMEQGEANGYPVNNAVAQIRLIDKQLTVEELRADLLGGQITAQGVAETDSQRFYLALRSKDLELAGLGLIPGLSGKVEMDLTLDGEKSLENSAINGFIAVTAGAWDNIRFDSLKTNFYKNGPNLTVDYFAARIGQGSITGQGQAAGNGINVSFNGSALPLDELAAAMPGVIIDGTADLEGTITGSLDRPEVQGRFHARAGQAFYQPFEDAAGTFVLSPEKLVIADAGIKQGATSHNLHGSLALTGGYEANLTITTRQARAENLIKLLAPDEKVTGNIDNTVTITGPLNDFSAEGKFTLTEGSYRGYLIARSEGSYRRAGGVTQVSGLTVHSLNTVLDVDGTIGRDNEFNLDVSARGVDIARLHLNYPYPVSGVVNLTGKVTGQPGDIAFNGELASDRLVLNGQPLDNVAGAFRMTGSEVNIPNFSFVQGNGQYHFTGGFNSQSAAISGSLDVAGGQLESLLAVLNTPVKGVAGQLNGRITVSGALSKPNVHLIGNMTKGSIKGYPLESIDVDVAMENQVITVNTFTANQGDGVLAIRGTADLNGRLDLEVGGRSIDAGLVTAWFDPDIDTKGQLSFAAQVSGTAIRPHAAVSLEITGGGVANATFDNLYGLLILDNESIHVNQLMLTKGAYRASAYGLIPLAALNQEGRRQATVADQMDLRIRLDQADLSILPLLTKEVAWASGETKGEVTVTGTLAQPLLKGGLLIRDGSVKLKSLADPIQKVGVEIQFEGDKINIQNFDGRMGGGSYRLTGSTRLKGLALDEYNLLLVLDKLGVRHKYFEGPLSGNLTVTQAGSLPKISGRILFENDTIDIPYFPEWQSGTANLAFDLEMVVGNRVRFHNPYMYDILATGKVKFGGTLRRPDASGKIEAQRGTVSYLRTQFKVKDGSVDFTQFRSFEPVIHLNAETKLDRTVVNLAVNGPVSTMDMQLTSQPAMAQQEILSLLTLRSRYYDKQKEGSGRDTGLSRDEVMSLLDVGLQMRFVAEMESAFRKAFGLDEFRFVRDTLESDSTAASTKNENNDREVYNVEISKYVTDRLALNYSMGIDHKEYTAGFRYEVNRRISLTGETDERDRRRFGIETRFRF
jgi:translocation and assembly module TamB